MRLATLSVLLFACGAAPVATMNGDATTTDVVVVDAEIPRCERWQVAFAIDQGRLDELSGLVFSPLQSRFFTHNDSGDSARFFAVQNGIEAIEYRLRNSTNDVSGARATSRDWEDVARVVVGENTFLFFADAGDNAARDGASHMETAQIYRVIEPRVNDSESDVAFARYDLHFADQPRDIEAIYAFARDGHISAVLVSKENANVAATLYLASLDDDRIATTQTLAPATTLAIGSQSLPGFMVTAADALPVNGRLLIALRTYTSILLFDADAQGLPRIDSLRVVPSPPELQGEAIALARAESTDRIRLYTVAEGAHPIVHTTLCRL